jgi:hypothetical protein
MVFVLDLQSASKQDEDSCLVLERAAVLLGRVRPAIPVLSVLALAGREDKYDLGQGWLGLIPRRGRIKTHMGSYSGTSWWATLGRDGRPWSQRAGPEVEGLKPHGKRDE